MICSKCKKDKPEVGHPSRDYTDLCSECFSKGFLASIFGKNNLDPHKRTK